MQDGITCDRMVGIDFKLWELSLCLIPSAKSLKAQVIVAVLFGSVATFFSFLNSFVNIVNYPFFAIFQQLAQSMYFLELFRSLS